MKWSIRVARRLATTLVLLLMAVAAAGDDFDFRAGGLLFGDFYYVASHHSEAGDEAAGVVVRRAYLTFDADFDANWFGRLRVEANQSGEFETYDFEADFKDLYLGRKFGRHRLLAGLSSTPTFDLIESEWGMRYLARTPLDLQGVPSRETGLAMKGPLDAAGNWSYRVMVDAGTDFAKDSNAQRRWMGALSWKPGAPWTIDLYADHEQRDGPTDRETFQVFAGYRTEDLRWGLQYANQDRENDPPLELASGYLVTRTGASTSLVLRLDRLFEPSPKGDDIDYLPFDPSAPATMLIAGLEFAAAEHVFLTPNVVLIHYDRDDQGQRPDDDLHLRLTLFFNFE